MILCFFFLVSLYQGPIDGKVALSSAPNHFQSNRPIILRGIFFVGIVCFCLDVKFILLEGFTISYGACVNELIVENV